MSWQVNKGFTIERKELKYENTNKNSQTQTTVPKKRGTTNE